MDEEWEKEYLSVICGTSTRTCGVGSTCMRVCVQRWKCRDRPTASVPVPVEESLMERVPSAVDLVVPPVVYFVAPEVNHVLPPTDRE